MARKFNALVIEGNEERLYYIGNTVKDMDIEVIKVSSGEDALMAIYNENIDIVLFDGDIKDMESLEVLETILTYERAYNIAVVLITEKEKSEKYILKAYKLGISDYIQKPINYKILKYKIKVLVKGIKEKRRYERKYLTLKNKVDKLEKNISRLSDEKLDAEIEMNIDSLTRIPNRKMFDQVLEDEWYRLMRSGDSLTVMMIDIDFFKQYNDEYGHIQGDKCLQKVAKVIDDSFHRVGDFIARYGGEEFVVIIPNFDYDDAKLMANKLRKNIEDAQIIHSASKILEYLSVSIGIATIIPNHKYTRIDVVDEADSALYLAKKSGRNIVKGISM